MVTKGTVSAIRITFSSTQQIAQGKVQTIRGDSTHVMGTVQIPKMYHTGKYS